MTQLIDKKAVLEAVKALPAELDAEAVQRCIEVLSNQPTVDAIPIEWLIEKYQIVGMSGTETYFKKAYAVHEIIKDWRTERNE